MKNFMRLTAPCIFVLTVLLSSPAFPLMTAFTTEQLARASDLIIAGEVEEVSSRWSDDGKKIVTRAVVVTGEIMKGGPAQHRTVVEYPGGEVGTVGLKVTDVMPLRKAEKVILFLRPLRDENGGTVYTMVARGQGKYSVDDNGVARKAGFSVLNGDGAIDYSISVSALKEKIGRTQ